MNKTRALAALAFLFMVASCASPQKAAGPVAFVRPALNELVYPHIKTDIPQTKRVTLSNGMKVHLMPDRELPLFSIVAMIRTGSIWEPEEKAGLAGLTGATIRSGGTVSRPPDMLDETLEFIAGSVETSIGSESGAASLSVLSKDTDLGLELFADVLRNPRFDPERFELAKAQTLDGIRRENDDPTQAAMRELNKLIYAGSPYGVYPTMESVQSITRADVMRFHKTSFVPRNIILGVTGDFDETQIIGKLEHAFDGWGGEPPVMPEVKPVEVSFDGGVYLVSKKLPQSVIRAGHLAGKRTDPDYHALRVMDEILGGSGFTSRLVQSVRTDRGLAYSVWSYTIGGRWERGKFMTGAETKASSTAEVIELIKREIERIRNEPVSAEELREARNAIVNRFIFIFDRPSKILKERMIVDYYGLPDDYLETFRDKVMAVTAQDIMNAARNRLHPEGMKIVVIGDPEKFDRPLSSFGQVTPIILRDYSDLSKKR